MREALPGLDKAPRPPHSPIVPLAIIALALFLLVLVLPLFFPDFARGLFLLGIIIIYITGTYSIESQLRETHEMLNQHFVIIESQLRETHELLDRNFGELHDQVTALQQVIPRDRH